MHSELSVLPACWPNESTTGATNLDKLHRELFQAMSDTASASDENFGDYFSALVKKAERAFLTEEQWLEQMDCEMLKAHREQHADVLHALHNIHPKILEKDFDLGRKVVRELLPQWYLVHVSTMDAALAIAMQANQFKESDLPPTTSDIYLD
jgi:hemerythrin